jgi:hypothetical protein
VTETAVRDELEIKNMAVIEDQRRRGVGRTLVRQPSNWPATKRVTSCAWPQRPPTSTTSASTSDSDSGCGRSSGTPSRPRPATEPARRSMESSYAIACGSTGPPTRRTSLPARSAAAPALHGKQQSLQGGLATCRRLVPGTMGRCGSPVDSRAALAASPSAGSPLSCVLVEGRG